jgi:hypothetical protein
MKNMLSVLSVVIVAVAVALSASVAHSQPDLREMSSSDIMAELEFLESTFPSLPEILGRLSTDEVRAFQNTLAAWSICESLDYSSYASYVTPYEDLFDFATPVALGKRSYEARASSGCPEEDASEQAIILRHFESIETYVNLLPLRETFREAIEARHQEMLRRTLPYQD